MYLNVKWSKLNVGSSFLLTCKERPNHLLAYVKRLSAHPGASAFSGRKSRCRWQHGPPDGKGIPGWSSRARSISQVAFPWAQELDPIFSPLKAKGQGGAARRECQTGLMCFVREKERHSTAGLPCSLTPPMFPCGGHTLHSEQDEPKTSPQLPAPPLDPMARQTPASRSLPVRRLREEQYSLPKGPPIPWKRPPASLPATVSRLGRTRTLPLHALPLALPRVKHTPTRVPVLLRRPSPALGGPCPVSPVPCPLSRIPRPLSPVLCPLPAHSPACARPLKDSGLNVSGAGPPAGGGREIGRAHV